MTTPSITSITPGQKKQFLRFVLVTVEEAAEQALEEAGIDKDGLQKLLGSGGDLQADLKPHILAAIKKHSLTNQFANEEVASAYAYPPEFKVKPVIEQGNILRQLFRGIGFADEESFADRKLVKHAEGRFVIPRWQNVAKTYGEAVEKVIAMIASQRKLYNYRQGQLGERYLRQTGKSASALGVLGEQQKGFDLLLVDAQFGLRHRGKSVRRAREVFAKNEFGLGAFATGIMLLTHPERLVKYEDLWIDCPGDEYDFEAGGRWLFAPIWGFRDVQLRFDARNVGDFYGNYGSASAFLPE